MENKEYTARKIKSAFNKIEKSGKRVTTTNICKLLGHPHLTDDEKRLVEIERNHRKMERTSEKGKGRTRSRGNKDRNNMGEK